MRQQLWPIPTWRQRRLAPHFRPSQSSTQSLTLTLSTSRERLEPSGTTLQFGETASSGATPSFGAIPWSGAIATVVLEMATSVVGPVSVMSERPTMSRKTKAYIALVIASGALLLLLAAGS